MLEAIFSYFSLHEKKYMFTDKLSGNKVYSFTDCYGRMWMKDSRWGFFSVEIFVDDNKDELAEAYDLLTNYEGV